MKSLHWLVLATAAIVAGCSGKPSPESAITCGEVESITYTAGPGGPVGFFLVTKSVAASDEGAGGAVPANGIVATVFSPIESVQICKGDCLDGSGSFSQEKDITTDENAILTYTLGMDPNTAFTGFITESFNALSSCQTEVTVN